MSMSARLKPIMDTLNRFSAWLLLLAIIWLCWVAARLLWLILAPPLAPALPLQALQNNANSAVDNSNLFAIFADPKPAAAAVQPPPNVELKGVLLAIPDSLSSALLDVNGDVKNYRIGDDLADSGFTLISVDWNAVIIADAADQQIVIELPEALPLDQRDLDDSAIGNQRLPNTGNASNTLPLPTQSPPIVTDDPPAEESQPADTSSAIEEAVSALKENPASYLSRMGVMASGEGYQVTAAMPSGLRNRLGLEAGDKVLTVNGQTVGSSPAQDATVLQQVQQSGAAQIEVQRGEQVITIRQQF